MGAFEVGSLSVGGDAPLILIAGPDVIESQALLMETCEALLQVTQPRSIPLVFKSSYEKANRSSGTSYAGPGIREGLKALAEVKDRFGVPVTTDVHETADVAPAAEVVDLIQIPAFLCRQTRLARIVAPTGLAVNIKKGQFMAPSGMHALVSKFAEAGNQRVMVTERGTTFGHHDLVVDMRGLVEMGRGGTPVIFDVTHSTQLPGAAGERSGGQRQYAAVLARAAAGAGIAGLFCEVHPEPASALCDADIQLTPAQLEAVLDQVQAIDLARRQTAGDGSRAAPTPGETL